MQAKATSFFQDSNMGQYFFPNRLDDWIWIGCQSENDPSSKKIQNFIQKLTPDVFQSVRAEYQPIFERNNEFFTEICGYISS